MTIRIDTFTTGPLATNAYLVTCLATQKCVLIDPALGSARGFQNVIQRRGLNPQYILLTHSHWDHIADVGECKRLWDIPVCVHPNDAPNLQRPGEDQLPIMVEMLEGIKPEHLFHEGETIPVGTISITVLETPGHSPGGVCFYLPEEQTLFSGDTLFPGTMGKVSFPTSLPEQMGPSLERLAALPKETTVYPGHGQQTTIGKETWLQNVRVFFPELYPRKS